MIDVIPLDFLGQGALLEPADTKLHDEAVVFLRRELRDGDKLNLAQFSKVWVGRKDREVLGVSGYVLRPDIPLCRATNADVLRALGKRMNDFFSDNGVRGKEVTLYLGNETEAQRCPEWRTVLKEFGAKSGRRLILEVK